jgi:hypothetical protein
MIAHRHEHRTESGSIASDRPVLRAQADEREGSQGAHIGGYMRGCEVGIASRIVTNLWFDGHRQIGLIRAGRSFLAHGGQVPRGVVSDR